MDTNDNRPNRPRRRPNGTRQPERRQQKPRPQARQSREAAKRTPPKPITRRMFRLQILTMLAVVAAIVLAFTLFFKVDTVSVSGNALYSQQDIINASGVKAGNNLLTMSRARIAGKIRAELPYVSSVRIGIKLPNAVNIDITELTVTYAVEDKDGGWILIDKTGKAVELTTKEEAAKHVQIQGVAVKPASVGSNVTAYEPPAKKEDTTTETSQTDTAANKLAAALQLVGNLEADADVGKVNSVDVTSLYDISLMYDGRVQVKFGNTTELEYKVQYMAAVMTKLEDYQVGTLDVTFQTEREARFLPKQ